MGKKKLGIVSPGLLDAITEWVIDTGEPSKILFILSDIMVEVAEDFKERKDTVSANVWKSLAKEVKRTAKGVQTGIEKDLFR